MGNFSTEKLEAKFNSTLKGSYAIIRWDLFLGVQGFLHTYRSINVMSHINGKIKNHMTNTIDVK